MSEFSAKAMIEAAAYLILMKNKFSKVLLERWRWMKEHQNLPWIMKTIEAILLRY